MTTFGLPAECGRFIQYETTSDLLELYSKGYLKGALHIGGGSNLLFTTGRHDGTVIHCADRSHSIQEPDHDGKVLLIAAAGCTLDDLCRITAALGLWGLENLSGIPGEIGGAAVQNVGAYGTEFKDVVKSVTVFDTVSGKEITLTAEECRYGYRDSVFKHTEPSGRYIVTGTAIELDTTPAPRLEYAPLKKLFGDTAADTLTPEMLRDAVISLRDSKLPDPHKTGSAGSFFKNPIISIDRHTEIEKKLNKEIPGHVTPTGEIKLSAAWLIDQAGCKSFTSGGAAVWQTQPLVIVNATGAATGNDVVTLEQRIINAVSETFGVELTPEVIHI